MDSHTLARRFVEFSHLTTAPHEACTKLLDSRLPVLVAVVDGCEAHGDKVGQYSGVGTTAGWAMHTASIQVTLTVDTGNTHCRHR